MKIIDNGLVKNIQMSFTRQIYIADIHTAQKKIC